MRQELARLRAARLVDVAVSTNLRGGKSAAANLGVSLSTGEIVVITDCDCTFDRDAIALLIAPLFDQRVGVVSGNIAVRNAEATLLSGLQALEYLLGIALGRRMLDMLGQVSCASGAFSAFRRSALLQLGGLENGAGEDLDVTLRMRRAGWQVRFAAEAWCLTDVPENFPRLLRQRLRWERDALRLRLRKHRVGIDPTDLGPPMREMLHRIEFLVAQVLPAIAFPLYLIWLASVFGTAAVTVLSMVTLFYLALDGIAALCALAVVNREGSWRLLPYVVLFGPLSGLPGSQHARRCLRPGMDIQELLSRQLHPCADPARGSVVLISQLHRSPRVDAMPNDLRYRRSRIGRWIYLGVLF
ncbi:MAG: glycosyltransferase, partial [Rhodospirillales bacterium]|nr:glycosyltransferase [Rhodospirillales bacterium]